jgi:hypothetical protein
MAADVVAARRLVNKTATVINKPLETSASRLATRLGLTPGELNSLTERMVRAALLSKPRDGIKFFADYLKNQAKKRSFHTTHGSSTNLFCSACDDEKLN